jgi:serine phosphatase RsbU (regulator of sigma subunit)
VEVAEEFARRLADAMANAETLAREHTIAETLQRAVLPDAFPDVPELDLAAGYLPASDGVHVGGDWYDVFLLWDNRVGLVIGDVAGHSITSASIMGQVRSMLRAYAIDRPDPGDVLRAQGPVPVMPSLVEGAARSLMPVEQRQHTQVLGASG